MFGRDSGDSHVVCPYDSTHIILAKSFNSHLIRCRKNHSHHKMVCCKFDKTHMVPKPELQHHHRTCPSRLLLDRELQLKSGVSNTLKGDVSGPEILSAYIEDTEEDWDAAPKFVARNALFSNKKDMEREEEEDYDPEATGFNQWASSASSSSSSSRIMEAQAVEEEENFRRVPLAPSKAAQLSCPAGVTRPVGSSSQVYQYSVQQVVGRGRGLGVQGRPGDNVAGPRPQSEPWAGHNQVRAPQRVPQPLATASPGRGAAPRGATPQAPHPTSLGRGIAVRGVAPQALLTPSLGRGMGGMGPAQVPAQQNLMGAWHQPQPPQVAQSHPSTDSYSRAVVSPSPTTSPSKMGRGRGLAAKSIVNA